MRLPSCRPSTLVLLAAVVACFRSNASRAGTTESSAAPRPNIVFILVDDLGLGDFSCYGNADLQTTHVDALAAEGIRFTQFYVGAPVCSASRVAFTTGQFPGRQRIYSYLDAREANRNRGMADFLDPAAPSLARQLKAAGYATSHIGKWHLGGGRDVGEAPLPQAYGFDESFTSFEGLGDRALISGDGLSNQSAELGQGETTWKAKHELTELYIDRAIDFIERRQDGPFYLQLWLNDVHDPYAPTKEQLARFERFAANPYLQQYYAVLEAMDRQLGRLVQAIDQRGLGGKTLILIASDNGPVGWQQYAEKGFDAPGSAAGLRGRKWSLYEGGIRSPLIARWHGVVPAGCVDETSVLASVDFLPTLCGLVGATLPKATLDGIDATSALRGTPLKRSRPVFWKLGRNAGGVVPTRPIDRSPPLAMRDGPWKLLANASHSRVELYDLLASPDELQNVAAEQPDIVARMLEALDAWNASLPRLDRVSRE